MFDRDALKNKSRTKAINKRLLQRGQELQKGNYH